jgi:hypothetical protein
MKSLHVIIFLLFSLLVSCDVVLPPLMDVSSYPLSNYNPTQPCFTPQQLSHYRIAPVADRQLSSASPLVIERAPWQGDYISTAYVQIVLEEVLNYRTIVMDGDGEISRGRERVARGQVDINPEYWPDLDNTYNDIIHEAIAEGQKSLVFGEFANGMVGQSGVYYPEFMLTDPLYANYNLDVLKAYQDPAYIDLFQPAGTIPDALCVGHGKKFIPEWCAVKKNPPDCILNGEDYVNGLCEVVEYGHCLEIIHQSDQYEPGFLQAIITKLHLNMTILYTDYNAYSLIQERVQNRIPFLGYSWQPVAFNVLEKISPIYINPQYGYHSFDISVLFSNRILTDPAYSDANSFLSQLKESNSLQEQLQTNVSAGSSQWSQDAFDIVCRHLHSTATAQTSWTLWISNTLPLPPVVTTIEEFSLATVAGLRAGTSLVLAFSVALHILLYLYRDRIELKRSSLVFCHCIVLGSFFAYAAVYLIAFVSSDNVCRAIPILIGLGFNITFGSLFAKTWRIHRIFNMKALQVQKLTNRYLLRYLGLLAIAEVIVNIVWILLSPLTAELVQSSSSHGLNYYYTCSSPNFATFLILLLLPKAVLLLASGYLAYSCRNIANNFNESFYICLSLAATIFTGIIIVPLILLTSNPSAVYILVFIAILFVFFLTQLFLFAPKFGLILGLIRANYSLNNYFGETDGSSTESAGKNNKYAANRLTNKGKDSLTKTPQLATGGKGSNNQGKPSSMKKNSQNNQTAQINNNSTADLTDFMLSPESPLFSPPHSTINSAAGFNTFKRLWAMIRQEELPVFKENVATFMQSNESFLATAILQLSRAVSLPGQLNSDSGAGEADQQVDQGQTVNSFDTDSPIVSR